MAIGQDNAVYRAVAWVIEELSGPMDQVFFLAGGDYFAFMQKRPKLRTIKHLVIIHYINHSPVISDFAAAPHNERYFPKWLRN